MSRVKMITDIIDWELAMAQDERYLIECEDMQCFDNEFYYDDHDLDYKP